ncbi:MAG: DUF4337 family protein [Pseudomonadota bacterium]|nr:DUF4337 family protein [Pseudomonadota bacterium]
MSNAAAADPVPAPAEADDGGARRFELLSGLTLALLAAVLAVVDLGGGAAGDDEIIGTNEKSSLYQWYQSKSIKQAIVEQQQGLLTALLDAGAVAPGGIDAVRAQIAAADEDVKRYDAEKRELLRGSEAVGPAGQVMEVGGEKGKIVGTEVWEVTLATLGEAGQKFDLSTLWLQLSLVLGAVSLVLHAPRLKMAFYAAMALGGVIGTAYGVMAFQVMMSLG